jgi:hypothetical protein
VQEEIDALEAQHGRGVTLGEVGEMSVQNQLYEMAFTLEALRESKYYEVMQREDAIDKRFENLEYRKRDLERQHAQARARLGMARDRPVDLDAEGVDLINQFPAPMTVAMTPEEQDAMLNDIIDFTKDELTEIIAESVAMVPDTLEEAVESELEESLKGFIAQIS